MNRVWTGVAAGVLAAAVLLGVGIGAYNAGQNDDDNVRVVTEQVGEGSDGDVVRVVERDRDWHGPGFGFFLIPLFVILGIVLLTRAGHHRHRYWGGPGWGHGYGPGYAYRGPGPCGPGDPDNPARAWHRRMHEADEADDEDDADDDTVSQSARPTPPDAG